MRIIFLYELKLGHNTYKETQNESFMKVLKVIELLDLGSRKFPFDNMNLDKLWSYANHDNILKNIFKVDLRLSA